MRSAVFSEMTGVAVNLPQTPVRLRAVVTGYWKPGGMHYMHSPRSPVRIYIYTYILTTKANVECAVISIEVIDTAGDYHFDVDDFVAGYSRKLDMATTTR